MKKRVHNRRCPLKSLHNITLFSELGDDSLRVMHELWALTSRAEIFRLRASTAERFSSNQVTDTEVGWVIREAEQSEARPDPKKPADTARCSRGLELRKQ